METSTVIAIIVAIILVGAIIAFVLSRSGGRRAEAERARAAALREKAQEHEREFREREANAVETRAQAEMARAEAKKQELEAERLAAEAENRAQSAAAVRQERDEQLRRADLRDPDVRTDKQGYRIDEHGNRLGEGQPGVEGTTSDHDRRGVPGEHRAEAVRTDPVATDPADDPQRVGTGRDEHGLRADEPDRDSYQEGYEEGRSEAEQDRGQAGSRDRRA